MLYVKHAFIGMVYLKSFMCKGKWLNIDNKLSSLRLHYLEKIHVNKKHYCYLLEIV